VRFRAAAVHALCDRAADRKCSPANALRNLTDPTGLVGDGSGTTGNYVANAACRFLIRPDTYDLSRGDVLQLFFYAFDVEPDATCSRDWVCVHSRAPKPRCGRVTRAARQVRIYDGPDSSAPLIASAPPRAPVHSSRALTRACARAPALCNTNPPSAAGYNASDGQLFIEFSADGAGQYGGWDAVYAVRRGIWVTPATWTPLSYQMVTIHGYFGGWGSVQNVKICGLDTPAAAFSSSGFLSAPHRVEVPIAGNIVSAALGSTFTPATCTVSVTTTARGVLNTTMQLAPGAWSLAAASVLTARQRWSRRRTATRQIRRASPPSAAASRARAATGRAGCGSTAFAATSPTWRPGASRST
jgi:hypothetical protein